MDIKKHSKVQQIAKNVLTDLVNHISSSSTESTIATTAEELLSKYDVSETWYYNTPALVLLGSRSCLSVSGKDYIPAHEPIGEVNLVTVDLSPRISNTWGDCARSFVVENGQVTQTPKSSAFIEGMETEETLHRKMCKYVTPETTFSELYEYGNHLICKLGFENIDFLQNLGHSIEINLEQRRYIDKDCHEKLGTVNFFTFEPHIRKNGKVWGFKHENIYYFDSKKRVREL